MPPKAKGATNGEKGMVGKVCGFGAALGPSRYSQRKSKEVQLSVTSKGKSPLEGKGRYHLVPKAVEPPGLGKSAKKLTDAYAVGRQ